MPTPNLFKDYTDSLWIVKSLFEHSNNDQFTELLEDIINRVTGGGESSGCAFPDDPHPEIEGDEEEAFEGILVWYFDEEKIFSEQEFYGVMMIACEKYIELNPNKKSVVNAILAKWKFS
jgi:CDI immunity protein